MEESPEYGVAAICESPDREPKAMHIQVGGDHYKTMKIQPVEFCMANNLNFCVSSAIKYLCRYKSKGGKQDLEKAKHFISLLIELEYPITNN
ncbi:MAG: DUF3310 domain-containing protein [Muribaculaceae bacterium]|nr:DUF3310 domain-containing protein [Muribaculaceae bacterium]